RRADHVEEGVKTGNPAPPSRRPRRPDRPHHRTGRLQGRADRRLRVEGSRHGVPDIDLTHYAERYAAVKDIMGATALPIMVDCDDAYGDVKNVTYTVRGYMALGVQAIFIEDQQAPKQCGHMDDKKVVAPEQMVAKIKAAIAAK